MAAASLAQTRAINDIDLVSRAGLDTATFMSEFYGALTRALPASGACVSSFDPASTMVTATTKHGRIQGLDEHDYRWGTIEYGLDEASSFRNLVRHGTASVALDATALDAPARLTEFLQPLFGIGSELRLVGRVAQRAWGGVALFRDDGDPAFTDDDVAFVASLSAAFGTGVRSSIIAGYVATAPSTATGPRIVIVDANDRVSSISPAAAVLLDDVSATGAFAAAESWLAGVVTCARRFASGLDPEPPRIRLRLPCGSWVIAHATSLSARDGASGDVAVAIEDARPPEVVPLVVEAFGLSERERQVAELVLFGVETREIAATLHMSRYTVQDHLKSIFDKADVNSRRELIGRVFFEQYVTRHDHDLAPSGWFSEGSYPVLNPR